MHISNIVGGTAFFVEKETFPPIFFYKLLPLFSSDNLNHVRRGLYKFNLLKSANKVVHRLVKEEVTGSKLGKYITLQLKTLNILPTGVSCAI